MSTRKSNGRPEDRPIRMAATAKKCMRFRKMEDGRFFQLIQQQIGLQHM